MSVCVSSCVFMCVHFWGVHAHRDHLCVCMGVDAQLVHVDLGVCMHTHECPCVHSHTSVCTSGWVGVRVSVYMCCCVQTWRSVHT